ncbi:MAG TPA: ROK family protein [Acidobacteriaceae bacterium]
MKTSSQTAPEPVSPSASASSVLVYDIGGSHISAAVCQHPGYSLHGVVHAPLPAADSGTGHFSAASFGRLIHTLGEAAAAKAGVAMESIAGASLAFPGPFDYENGVSHMQHKLHSLYGVDLKAGLATRFHWKLDQLHFLNDAAAFTLGEAGAGAAREAQRILGITLGTGIGGAFAIRAGAGVHIADSKPGNREGVPVGGELWNLPYTGDGAAHPGASSTVEDFVSTRFLRHHFQVLTGREEEVSAIADTAQNGQNAQPCPDPPPPPPQRPDPNDLQAAHCRARQAFQDFGRHLGQALNLHAAAFRPDVVVIGGGIARASALFLPATRKALTFPTKIAVAELMDEAALAGAGVHFFTRRA